MNRPDLNLVVALHALLEERHVTRAAQRIGVGQPAASAMLARLRRHFDDELLTRVGNRYELTPLGAFLRDRAAGVLEMNDRLFAIKSRFDPARTEREFVIGISDYALGVLGPRLLERFEEEAPDARLTFRLHASPDHDSDGDIALRSVDGMILPYGNPHKHLPHKELLRDEWVLLLDAANDLAGGAPSREVLSELRWVVAYGDPAHPTPGTGQLEAAGVTMRHLTVVDSFRMVPHFITGSRRVGVVQRRLAESLPENLGLRAIPVPYPMPELVLAFWWHPINTVDAGHSWLRELLGQVAAELGAG
ncbi:LysR family transcriptional regulator [Streptomyces sp. NPDC046727]|uniref:LysR family transcriptional regulator n=1 Tax=Streptomyces sp. NPDC046727 TaxID=3155373 RepID=UPI0033D08E4E